MAAKYFCNWNELKLCACSTSVQDDLWSIKECSKVKSYVVLCLKVY